MNTTDLLEQTGFHDASVSALLMEGDHIHIRFENVLLDDGSYNVALDLGGVRRVTCNGEAVDALRIKGEGSSVIDFERRDGTATLVVDWRSYKARTSETYAYEFSFTTFGLQAEKQE